MQMCVNLWGYLYCLINQNDVKLHRDDRLIVVKKLNGQHTNKTRKNIVQVVENHGFKTKIKTNLLEVGFLDIISNLIKGTF